MNPTTAGLARILNARGGHYSDGFEDRGAIGPHEVHRIFLHPAGPMPDGSPTYAIGSPLDPMEWLSWDRNADGSMRLSWRPNVPGQPGPWERWRADLPNRRLVSVEFPDKDFYFIGTLPVDTPPTTPAEPFEIDGLNFVQMSDRRIVKVRGLTAFTALEDWLNGRQKKLEAYARFTRAMQRNLWRVFLMWHRTGFTPRDYANFYVGLDELARWTKSQGIYLMATEFTDQVENRPKPGEIGASVLMSPTDRDIHHRRTIDVLRNHATVLDELNNEDFNNGNIASAFASHTFAGVPSTRSSWPDGQSPETPGPILNFTSEHTPRGDEFERKSKNMLETARLGFGSAPGVDPPWTFPASRRPAIGGEPQRIAEGTTPRAHADYHAIAELFSAGAILHGGDPVVGQGSSLQRCIAPEGGDALACCEAVRDVIASQAIPLNAAADGEYSATHMGNAVCEEAGAIRSYAMLFGDHGTLVRARETAAPTFKNGWRRVAATGPHAQIYLIAR